MRTRENPLSLENYRAKPPAYTSGHGGPKAGGDGWQRPYEHDTVSDEHSQYHPDFYYPRIKLYHEHFALDDKGNAPAHFSGDYVGGVRWKRTLHAEKETQLFETTSHGLRNGDDLDRLKLELEQRGEVLEFDESRGSPYPKVRLARPAIKGRWLFETGGIVNHFSAVHRFPDAAQLRR